jgi:hypothetical protein
LGCGGGSLTPANTTSLLLVGWSNTTTVTKLLSQLASGNTSTTVITSSGVDVSTVLCAYSTSFSYSILFARPTAAPTSGLGTLTDQNGGGKSPPTPFVQTAGFAALVGTLALLLALAVVGGVYWRWRGGRGAREYGVGVVPEPRSPKSPKSPKTAAGGKVSLTHR